MTNMISVATGFQSSVNIAYDMNDDGKLKNYIPTKSALSLLEDVLLSTSQNSTDRARILIGAYGKGKSHIVLMILSILMKKDPELFEKMMPVISSEKPELYQLIQNYYHGSNKILPVVISGSSNSLAQAFLLALERTLAENELTDIMPETNYQAAINTIVKWKSNFPETYNCFKTLIDGQANKFIERLHDFDPSAYAEFEKLYPSLTAGSHFNPFVGFDVAELYEEVVKALKPKGYTGIYVIYDEFSKYLENHISDATKSDTKMLQDFAEKCGRSGKSQLHLMLISHKEITSYIERASKAMVDGWRGVSERFRHIYLNNNFTQTYEIIAAAIEKNEKKWNKFKKEYSTSFEAMKTLYEQHPLFSDFYEEGIDKVIYDCYPLHPVSTFVLPRLSERVAQNERTLFTFISAKGDSTLSSFLSQHADEEFALATPDLIYDYFEPLLKQEVYAGNLHKYYVLTSSILRKIDDNSLEAKIVKTLTLIYILEHFEKLKPTLDELTGIYSYYGTDAVNDAVKRLVEDKYVVYLKRSNNYLRLKETSGVDVHTEIINMIGKRAPKLDIKNVLNESNFDHYLYPSRYNDEKEMTRYFDFRFIDVSEVREDTNWVLKREDINADGVIFAVVPNAETNITNLKKTLKKASENCLDCVFVLPDKYTDIRDSVAEFDAVEALMQTVSDDPILFEDYEVVYEDMRDVLRGFISGYTRPEKHCSTYIFNGDVKKVARKSDLTNLLSDICDNIYGLTPVINNEVINKEEITTVTRNSRAKLIAGILRTELEPNLGLSGTGQEVSIMRSTLINTGVLEAADTNGIHINLKPNNNLLAGALKVMESFVTNSRKEDSLSFAQLYKELSGAEMHIGMRKGLIPIYLAAVLHEYKKEVVISDRFGQVPMNANTMEQLNAEPEMFTLAYIDWNSDKEVYISSLEDMFGEYGVEDANVTPYERVMASMKRWYMDLPKYSKNTKTINGKKINKEDRAFLQEMRKNAGSYDLVFRVLPKIYGVDKVDKTLADKIYTTKEHYDGALGYLKGGLVKMMRELFCTLDASECKKMSLSSIIRDWCEKLDEAVFEQLFTDGTERCLTVFKAVTNDEDSFITKVAKMATDLRIEDWDEDVVIMFERNMKQYRETAESFHHTEEVVGKEAKTEGYELTYQTADGKAVRKRFEKVEESKRGKLLYNSIISQIDSMGQAISEQEKRQILMEILKKLC